MSSRRPLLFALALLLSAAPLRADDQTELRPRFVDGAIIGSVRKGLDYLARTQGEDGSWSNGQDGAAYPVTMTALAGMAFLANGNTTTRGPYADQVRKTADFLLSCAKPNGLITGPGEDSGRSMYGHGFALMFLSCAHGMENDARTRERMGKVITAAIALTATGQSRAGGWTYTPGGGDEGSVTVTQIQALRAAHNAGFVVPKGVIKSSIHYLELCRAPEGGIVYSLGSGPPARLAISAGALASMYNAGEYDSPMAAACLRYVRREFDAHKEWSKGSGHEYYTHLYAAQAFYQAGDKYWDAYYPAASKQLVAMQQPDGAWNGDGVGPVYGTAIAVTILQLPYKFLPIYQR